jgi:hypothetical protein
LTEILQLGILESKALELVLDALSLALLDLDLPNLDVPLLQRLYHRLLLARTQQQQRLALRLVSRRPPNSMDVRVRVFRAVDLDDPVDGGEVETSGGNVGGEEAAGRGSGEAVEDIESFRLLLLTVQLEKRHSWVELAEGFVDEADLPIQSIRQKASVHQHDDRARASE